MNYILSDPDTIPFPPLNINDFLYIYSEFRGYDVDPFGFRGYVNPFGFRRKYYVDTSVNFDVNTVDKYFRDIGPQLPIDQDNLVNKNLGDLDQYTCPICLCILNDPYSLKCNHIFCKSCLENIDSRLCPLCRSYYSMDDMIEQLKLKNEINNWLIKCEVCNLEHTIGDKCCRGFICNICGSIVYCKGFLNHLEKQCGIDKDGIIRTCKKCKEQVFREHLGKHPNECPKRRILCKYCKRYITYDQMDDHGNICQAELVKCDTCKGYFKRILIDMHQLRCKPREPVDKKYIPNTRNINTDYTKLSSIRDRLKKKIINKQNLR